MAAENLAAAVPKTRRYGAFPDGIRDVVPARWSYALPLFIVLAFAVIAPMLVLGSPDGHDFEFHITTWIETVQQWRAGVWFPRWDRWANYGFGEPRFIFYPPLSRLLGAAALFVFPANAAPAAYYFLIVVIAGASMFALARQWLPSPHAIVAAAFYAVNPYLLLCIYQRSAAAEMLVVAFVPLLALFAIRLPAGNRAIPPLAVVFAVFWVSDLPAAVIITYALALTVAVLSIVHRSLAVFFRGAVAMILGFGLVAFYVLPAAYEQRWVNIADAISSEFRPENWEYTWTFDAEALWFYPVLSGIVYFEISMATVAGVLSWSRRREHGAIWWLSAIVTTTAIFMILPVSHIVWTFLPKLEFVQFPWRWLVVLTVCMTAGVAAVLARFRVRWLVLLLLPVAALGGIATGATTLWNRGAVDYYDETIRMAGGYEGSTQFMPPSVTPEKLAAVRREPAVAAPGSSAFVQVLQWDPEDKAVLVRSATPTTLVFRILDYPGWRATINGRPASHSTDDTGRLTVPVSAGESRVEVRFLRTPDRIVGIVVSLFVVLVLVGCWIVTLRSRAAPEGGVRM
jgi:hypothetical protein